MITAKFTLGLLLVLCCGPSVFGADGGSKAAPTFSPEIEAKLPRLFEKAEQAKRKQWARQVKKEVEDLAKLTSLNGERIKSLETAAAEVTNVCLQEWLPVMTGYFRETFSRFPERLLNVIEQPDDQIEAYIGMGRLASSTSPLHHAAWIGTLERVLTPDELAAWTKFQTERKESIGKEIAGVVEASVERTRDGRLRVNLAKAGGIGRLLALPGERVGKLKETARRAADKSAERIRERIEKMLFEMPAEQRRQMVKHRGLYMSADASDTLEEKAIWDELLGQLLSSDESQRYREAEKESRARRLKALGRMLLAEMDRKIALTAKQREGLQPVLEDLAEKALENEHLGIGSHLFRVVFSDPSVSEQKLKPILASVQWERWQRFLANNDEDNMMSTPEELKKTQAPVSVEPEGCEQVISDFLVEKSAKQEDRMVADATLRVEDAARVADLPPATVARLQTAAKGAAEVSLVDWKMNLERAVRGHTRNATAQNIRQRLASIESYQLQGHVGFEPENAPVWTKAVTTILSDAQRAAWKVETDARSAYLDAAIASFIVLAADRHSSLTADQWQKLVPKIEAIVKEYRPDIGRMFGSYNREPWYFEGYYMMLPFAGIPEEEIKGILAKEQWDGLSQTQEFSNALSYWTNIQQNHEQRKPRR